MRNKPVAENSLKTLKFRNRKLVLSFLREAGAVPVNAVSRATSLSKMTVHKIIEHYLKENVVILTGKGDSTEDGGKKPNLFAFNHDYAHIFAVCIAGAELRSVIVNLKGDFLTEHRRDPLRAAGAPELFDAIDRVFRDHMAALGTPRSRCLAAVVCCDGMVDEETGLCPALRDHPEWGTDIPLRDGIGKILPEGIPVYFDSWWHHMIRGVMASTETRGLDRCFLIGNFEERVAGGMVQGGALCQGATGLAGEIGHVVVDFGSEEPCDCGAKGCFETMVAPGKLAARAERLRQSWPDSLVFGDGRGEGTSFARIASAANQGDELGRHLMRQTADCFAAAMTTVARVCDPGTFVIFGEYARAGDFFHAALRERLQATAPRGVDEKTTILRVPFQDDGAPMGIASFVSDLHFDKFIQ